MKTFALLAVVLLADPNQQQQSQRPTIPPRDPHPFGAIETRPRWERPASRDPRTVQQRTEDALDRSTGRIEDDASFQVRQLERERELERLRHDAYWQSRPREEWERFREERDRQERIEDQRMKLERARRESQRVVERESDALADVRRRFEQEANRPNSALGSIVDRQMLTAVEQEYRGAAAAAERSHSAAVAAIDADDALAPDARAARRTAADRQLEQQLDAAARRWEARRKEVLGQK